MKQSGGVDPEGWTQNVKTGNQPEAKRQQEMGAPKQDPRLEKRQKAKDGVVWEKS